MTDTFGATPDDFADDINDEPSATTRLDREASAFLAQADRTASGATTSVRKAIREDLDHGREWTREKVESTRDAIVEQPLTSAIYALGVGILIGLLIRR